MNKPLTLVLGGNKGLGYLVATRLLREEMVMRVSRSEVRIGYDTLDLPGVNLMDGETVADLYDWFEQHGWFPTKIINCVGANLIKPTEDLTQNEWSRILDSNVTGILGFVQTHLRRQLEHGVQRTTLINIGSNAADGAGAMSIAYVAAKHALTGVTRSLARDYAQQMTTFQINLPQFTGTEMSAYIELSQAQIKGQSVTDYRAMQDAKAPGGKLMSVQNAADLVTSLAGNYDDVLATLNGSIIRLGYPS